jgi:hypothetical protein
VAGVINVILDNGGDGGEIEASYGANHTDLKPIGRTLTDGQTGNISAKVGTSLGEDGGFLRVGWNTSTATAPTAPASTRFRRGTRRRTTWRCRASATTCWAMARARTSTCG